MQFQEMDADGSGSLTTDDIKLILEQKKVAEGAEAAAQEAP